MSGDKDYDEQVFQQVRAGIRGNKPKGDKATPAEVRKAREQIKKDRKRFRRKDDGDVIDTGMFGS